MCALAEPPTKKIKVAITTSENAEHIFRGLRIIIIEKEIGKVQANILKKNITTRGSPHLLM